MVTRKEIANKAAKIAALGAYKAVMTAPVKKVATSVGEKDALPPVTEVAKIAAAAAYNGIVKAAQDMMKQVITWAVIGRDISKVAKGLYDWISRNGNGPVPAADIVRFRSWATTPSKFEGEKPNWAGSPEKWPAIVEAIIGNVDNPDQVRKALG
jgi:hypothetical protein